jgi:hypothetical protein
MRDHEMRDHEMRDDEVHKALIPTLVPRPAEWARVFGRHIQLGMAATAVYRELAGQRPDFELPTVPALSPQGQQVAPIALAELLKDLDDAYEAAAHASGPIVGSAHWQRLLALVDALRDVNDELTITQDQPAAPVLALVRSLTSAAARQIVALTKEITVKLGSDGLRHSPLWIGVRRMQRAAEAVADFGTPVNPLTSSRYANGRGALQAQLNAMRRNLQTASKAS